MLDQTTQIQDLETRVKKLEDNFMVFPTRLTFEQKRAINKAIFLSGAVQLNGAGAYEDLISGSDNNIVFAQDEDGVSLTTAIINSDITPGIRKLYIAGQPNHFIRYVVFLTEDPSN